MSTYAHISLFTMSPEQCAQARQLLRWSVDKLANTCGVSSLAIEQYESGFRKLRQISLQAIAYAFESEELVFFPGVPPMRGENMRGTCPDPRRSAEIGMLD